MFVFIIVIFFAFHNPKPQADTYLISVKISCLWRQWLSLGGFYSWVELEQNLPNNVIIICKCNISRTILIYICEHGLLEGKTWLLFSNNNRFGHKLFPTGNSYSTQYPIYSTIQHDSSIKPTVSVYHWLYFIGTVCSPASLISLALGCMILWCKVYKSTEQSSMTHWWSLQFPIFSTPLHDSFVQSLQFPLYSTI